MHENLSQRNNENYRIGLSTTVNVHVTFSQLMSSISLSQRRMDEKLAQFQEEVRVGQEDAAAKATKKARYHNSCV